MERLYGILLSDKSNWQNNTYHMIYMSSFLTINSYVLYSHTDTQTHTHTRKGISRSARLQTNLKNLRSSKEYRPWDLD